MIDEQQLKEIKLRAEELTKTNFVHSARCDLLALLAEVDALRVQLAERDEYYKNTINEYCQASDEKHCTCVPALRTEIKRLREALAGCMLLADDMTNNENERLALIAKRCRTELYSEDGGDG